LNTQTHSAPRGRVARIPYGQGSTALHKDAPADRSLVRLGLDLHDGPLQDLAAIGFSLGMLRQELEELPGDVERATSQLAETIQQLRALEHGLRALIANDSHNRACGLRQLVEEEIARFRRLDSAKLSLSCIGNIEPETDSQRIALHRITREALSNVMQHASASNVLVELVGTDDSIELSVVDDGNGFDVTAWERMPPGRSIGLHGMRKRVRMLGGSLTVRSRPGGPTVVTASITRWRPASR
jgi:two-component system NarL family sensor kinase